MSILRADSIRDRAGTGAPDFPNGLTGNVTGNVTGTASTATALSGTPNITVGTVTGTDATFSGNLTVQGTTTTIDTAVTAVDSLAVDGSVGIGTTSAESSLHIVGSIPNAPTKFGVHVGAHSGYGVMQFTSDTGGIIDFGESGVDSAGRIIYTHSDDALKFNTNNIERLRIHSSSINVGAPAIFKAGLAEKFQTGTTIQADPTIALSDGNIVLRTSNESGNQAINFTGVHSTLAVGEAVSFTVIITPNGSGAINNVQIDAAAQTIQWSGGSAPSAGAVGSRDVYTFTLLKTGSGTTDYDVYGAATNYA